MVRALATSDLTMNGTLTSNTHIGAVRLWLYAVAALVLAMVLVGGATRLTESGLSITEWKPVMGVVPPLSQNAWRLAPATEQAVTPPTWAPAFDVRLVSRLRRAREWDSSGGEGTAHRGTTGGQQWRRPKEQRS